jgi:hypothetical protein
MPIVEHQLHVHILDSLMFPQVVFNYKYIRPGVCIASIDQNLSDFK